MTSSADRANSTELTEFERHPDQAEVPDAFNIHGDHGSSLSSVDGGLQAWLFLTGCFLIEGFLWGFPFSYGVLQEYYRTHEPFSRDPYGLAAVGTTCSVRTFLWLVSQL